MLKQGDKFPNITIRTTDGSQMEAWDLYQKGQGLFWMAGESTPEVLAVAARFQEQAKLFTWLRVKLIIVFKDDKLVPSPWPAPGYQPYVYTGHLPDGMEWGKAYFMSRFRSIFEIYDEPEFLSVAKIEKDTTYYEANHC